MNRMRVALVHKIVPVSVVAFLLFCTPLQLVAQEREPRAAAAQVSMIEWFSSLWSDLTAWLASGVLPPPPDQTTNSLDDACSIDPWGGCHGS